MTYQPPQPLPSLSYRSPTIGNYLPLRGRARNARVMLWVCAALAPLGILAELFTINMSNRVARGETWTQEEAIAMAAPLIAVGCVGLIAYILTIVFFLMWAFRANKNLRALGQQSLEFSPGWTVGWWFIPIANLFKPYQAIRELYLASAPDAPGNFGWRAAAVPSIFGWWWACWIISNICDRISWQTGKTDNHDAIVVGCVVGMIGSVLSLCAALLCAKIVGDITNRVEDRALSQPLADPVPGTFPITPT